MGFFTHGTSIIRRSKLVDFNRNIEEEHSCGDCPICQAAQARDAMKGAIDGVVDSFHLDPFTAAGILASILAEANDENNGMFAE